MVASNPERPAVVLVDPHEDCRLIYPAILRHAGYDVLLATTVAEARDLLAQRRPVAVVAEARLPDGAAGDLVRALAAVCPNAPLPIVIFYAFLPMGERGWLRAHGAELIETPCAPRRLLNEIQRLASPPPSLAP